jgi:hypothetical protein
MVLLGEASSVCWSGASATATGHHLSGPRVRIKDKGNGRPKIVHGEVTLGVLGTSLDVVDACRGPGGLHVHVYSGEVSVTERVRARDGAVTVRTQDLHAPQTGRFTG